MTPTEQVASWLTLYRSVCALLGAGFCATVGLLVMHADVPTLLLVVMLWLTGSLSLLFGLLARAAARDLKVGLTTERCFVRSVIAIRNETLMVKTPSGSADLVNCTAHRAQDLNKRWVMLTYARHLQKALQAEILESEGA